MEEVESSNFTGPFKIGIIGPAQCGKSSIVFRYVHDEYTGEDEATVEDYIYYNFSVDGVNARTEVLDTSGNDCYQSLWTKWFTMCESYILVYSITSVDSFSHAKEMYAHLIKERKGRPFCFILCGNKVDQEKSRLVNEDVANSFAKNHNGRYFEVSAKSGYNVHEMFSAIIREIRNRHLYVYNEVPSPAPTLRQSDVITKLDRERIRSLSLYGIPKEIEAKQKSRAKAKTLRPARSVENSPPKERKKKKKEKKEINTKEGKQETGLDPRQVVTLRPRIQYSETRKSLAEEINQIKKYRYTTSALENDEIKALSEQVSKLDFNRSPAFRIQSEPVVAINFSNSNSNTNINTNNGKESNNSNSNSNSNESFTKLNSNSSNSNGTLKVSQENSKSSLKSSSEKKETKVTNALPPLTPINSSTLKPKAKKLLGMDDSMLAHFSKSKKFSTVRF